MSKNVTVMKIILGIVIGAGIGFGLGYLGKCTLRDLSAD